METEESYILTILFILGIELIFSAVISGYEAAFFSLKESEISSLKSTVKNKLNKFINKPQQLLATILIANNLVNIGIVITTVFLFEQLNLNETLSSILEATFSLGILLLVGEILPKTYAVKNKIKIINFVSPLLIALYYLLYPFAFILAWSSKLFPEAKDDKNLNLEHLLKIIEKVPENVAPPEEKKLLRALLKLNRSTVKAIMTPRTEIVAIPYNYSNEEVLQFHEQKPFSKYPVYKKDLDHIRGILFAKDLIHIKYGESDNWQNFIKEPVYIIENARISALMTLFKEKKVNIVIVVDEYGGTAGIVTINDLINEVFFDNKEAEKNIKKRSDKYTAAGNTSIIDFLEEIGENTAYFDEVRGDTETLAGLFLEHYQKIPKTNDTVQIKDFIFKVKKIENHAIKELEIVRKKN